MDFKELIDYAKEVLKPKKLSDCVEVGGVAAAILTTSGNLYRGVCIDTACSMGFCAEHSAAALMITNGESEIEKIVAINWDGRVIPPCGRCREFIMQINNKNINTDVMVKEDKVVKLKELLPYDWRESISQ